VITGLLALPSPRLPARRGPRTAALLALAVALHLIAAAALVIFVVPAAAPTASSQETARAEPSMMPIVLPRHLIFLPTPAAGGGGGGGGGNRQSGPIRHAEGIGRDAMTLRTTKRPPTAGPLALEVEPALPAVVLDALPLASGTMEQMGLPVGGVSTGTSTGTGTGGGVGTGEGTGIGSGRGPGIGPGSGGGFGGGAYRPGGSVTAPRLISQIRPNYTPDALERRIQGAVWLDVVVMRDGCPGAVRVARSLDPAGLDEEAIKAIRAWRFEPGRLSGVPVDVLVTVVMDFSIR
jgi:TonB family protein